MKHITESLILVQQDIDDIFEINTHLPYIWQELRTVGLDSGEVAIMFWKKFPDEEMEIDISREFLIFGITELNPILNSMLGREEDHPSFEEMVELAICDWETRVRLN
jgi:hypothetical protein